MSIRGYSFVFALRKCNKAAFGEQNKMKGTIIKNKNTASMMPIKIIKNQENNLFVFAQMNAVHCIGEQDQKK